MLGIFRRILYERIHSLSMLMGSNKHYVISVLLTVFVAACGGSEGSSSDGGTSIAINPSQAVTISGTLTYDLVPQTNQGPLDYDSMTQEPIRGATVRLLDNADSIIMETVSSADGEYSLTGQENTDYRVQVLAELSRSGQPSWNIRVTDNTQNLAIYALEGALVNSGNVDSRRDLHAESGWSGTSYTSTRAAGPFAILDSTYEALQVVLEADASIELAPVELRWSILNQPAAGELDEGNISTSFFSPARGSIYILGAEDQDTDEYDRSIVQHEFMHYLEDAISRSDSPGGSHSLNQGLDIRVAYSEALGNAFTAFVDGTGVYSDSLGARQAFGLGFSLETTDDRLIPGWFNEGTVGYVIYDIADAQADDGDALALGFSPILQAMKSPTFIDSDAFTSLYLLREEIARNLNESDSQALTNLMESQQIFGEDLYGTNEINTGGFFASLPIYETVELGTDVVVCTANAFGEFNTFDNRRFVRFTLQGDTTVNISISSVPIVDAIAETQTIARLFSQGDEVAFYVGNNSGLIDENERLPSGTYVLELLDLQNIDSSNSTGGLACFQVTLSEQ